MFHIDSVDKCSVLLASVFKGNVESYAWKKYFRFSWYINMAIWENICYV